MLPAMRFSGFFSLSSAAAVLLHAVLLSTVLAADAQAAPPGAGSAAHTDPAGTPSNAGNAGNASDDLGRFLNDNGLLLKIEQAGQRVGHKASELVVNALGFLGVPYRMGGNTVETGFDCSGFVRAMFQQTVGLILPRKAEQQAAATEKIDRSDLQPGDLVFFNTLKRAFSHVGIYVGEGKFVHSPRPGGQVRVENMSVSYWNHRFDGARRVGAPGVAAPGVAAPQFPKMQPIQPPPLNQPGSLAPAMQLADPLARFSAN